MKLRDISKGATFAAAMGWLIIFCFFTASTLGTLAHELMHSTHMDQSLIVVNFDSSGYVSGSYFEKEDHGYVYLVGYAIEGFLMFLSILSLVIIISYTKDDQSSYKSP